jgi:hypothetical protein
MNMSGCRVPQRGTAYHATLNNSSDPGLAFTILEIVHGYMHLYMVRAELSKLQIKMQSCFTSALLFSFDQKVCKRKTTQNL